MNNLGIIYDKVKSYAQKDKFEMFAECVKEKLEVHLIDYYNRLSSKLERAYNKVIQTEDVRILKEANKQLNKVERPRF